MPVFIECVENDVTLGEICLVLRQCVRRIPLTRLGVSGKLGAWRKCYA